MFSFLKKKPKLVDLIPEGLVDIHSHILPGLDDGAKNVSQSIRLIEGMKKIGFGEVIATPHTMSGVWDNNSEDIKKSYESLKNKLEVSQSDISFASEYMMDITFLEKIQSQNLLCLKDNYVLVELSYFQAPVNLYEILFELQLKGYIPILAHPERYSYFFNEFKNFEKLKNAGCLFQLNLMSVVGHYGLDSIRIADKLLGEGLIDYVGSDIHHSGHLEVFVKPVRIKNLSKIESRIGANKFFKQ